MPAFEFWSVTIDMETQDFDSIAKMLDHPKATLSFVHEYVHFIQSCSSLMGFNLLEQLVNVGIAGAVVLSGLEGPQRDLDIIGLLEHLPDRAGRNHSEISTKMRALADEMKVLTDMIDDPYTGEEAPWSIVEQKIVRGTHEWNYWGFVTPRETFRPFTPLIAIEGVARRVDRWYSINEKFIGHEWPATNEEDEVYNGLRNLLLQPRYSHVVSGDNADALTVVIGSLSLLAPHPDWAIKEMLAFIEGMTAWLPIAAIERDLRELLIANNELHADFFNETMCRIQHGNALMMARTQYLGIYDQLKLIHAASKRMLSGPGVLFHPDICWNSFQQMLAVYSVPPVKVNDWIDFEVAGIEANRELHRFVSLVVRKLM